MVFEDKLFARTAALVQSGRHRESCSCLAGIRSLNRAKASLIFGRESSGESPGGGQEEDHVGVQKECAELRSRLVLSTNRIFMRFR